MNKNSNLQQLVRAALLIAIGVILPLAFHSIKNAGSIFLPMHIPILIGGFILNPYYALCVGIITPILSSIFTGMPPIPFIYVMILELTSYGIVISLLYNKAKIGLYPSLILGMLSGRVMSIIGNYLILHILMNKPFKITTVALGLFIQGIPGIVIQIILIPLIIYALQKLYIWGLTKMDNKIFFNSLAENWDKNCCHPSEKVNYIIGKMGLKNGDTILDIGSGTGITIPYLEKKIGLSGKITALDIAEKMIEVSRKKNIYSNLDFEIKDFFEYNTPKKFNHILAYSCYPHFTDEERFFEKSYSLLEVKGKIVIAHIESKEAINSRHMEVEDHIISHILPDIEKICELACNQGFEIIYKEDNKDYYIFVGEKIAREPFGRL